MKTISMIPLALGLVLGLTGAAQAYTYAPGSLPTNRSVAHGPAHHSSHAERHHGHYHGQNDYRPHHRGRCTGLTSGTAHRHCGTRSGGPVGGLHH